MIRRRTLLAGTSAIAASAPIASPARTSGRFGQLEAALREIEAARGGRLGVAVLDSASGEAAGHRATERFPLTSTFKLLAAGAVLAQVDAGRMRLDDRIRYRREEVVTYSPVTERHAGADGMTVGQLCEATMTLSDNTAANLLLRGLGGPAGLTAWLRGIGDDVTRLDRWETALNEARPGDPRDTTTPAAMLATMQRLTLGDVLSPGSRAHLLAWLRANRTGGTRLRAGLPPRWQAGERTGTGPNGTSNDVGLVWPPSGAPLLVAAYLTEGAADMATRDAALADVGASVAAAWRDGRPWRSAAQDRGSTLSGIL
ncbi:class A beta-lactamase [Falsiroseomonas bella]|uniref:class A beta-lactamase n=1 Tax=Falsiroseomonas bella TaxID=2184016 RepID=UPI0018EE5E9B|nr:class A beta-lactamase [Falsiroseomonas bella]